MDQETVTAKRNSVIRILENSTWPWDIVIALGFGYFSCNYALFAPKSIFTALDYVYWRGSTEHESVILIATSAGTFAGHILFGLIADWKGRKSLYKRLHQLLIGTTLGLVMSSSGQGQSMNVLDWMIWWRLVQSFVIGGILPLTAVMIAEFAPAHKRARMAATIVSIERVAHVAVDLVVIEGSVSLKTTEQLSITRMDTLWRIVVGIGALFPIIAWALFSTYKIPESPRWRHRGQQSLPNIAVMNEHENKHSSVLLKQIPEIPEEDSQSNYTLESEATKVEFDAQHPSSGEVFELDAFEQQLRKSQLWQRRPSSGPLPPVLPLYNQPMGPTDVSQRSSSKPDIMSPVSPTQTSFRSFSPVSSLGSGGHTRKRSGALIHTMFRNLMRSELQPPSEPQPQNRSSEMFAYAPEVVIEIPKLPTSRRVSYSTAVPDDTAGQQEEYVPKPQELRESPPSHTCSLEPTLWQYFWAEGNWRYLCITATSCFTFGLICYGLGNTSGQVMAVFYTISGPDPERSIYDIVKFERFRSLVTANLPALAAALLWIWAIPFTTSKRLFLWATVLLGALFSILGIIIQVISTKSSIHAVVLYGACQLLVDMSPASVFLFIIPTEIFPTRYRATCAGLSAAAGRLGMIAGHLSFPKSNIVAIASFHNQTRTEITITETNANTVGEVEATSKARQLGACLFVFAALLFACVVGIRAWMPDIQYTREDRKGETKRLEVLEGGRAFEVLVDGRHERTPSMQLKGGNVV